MKELDVVYYQIKEKPPAQQKPAIATPQVKTAEDEAVPMVKKEDFFQIPKKPVPEPSKPKIEVKEPEPKLEKLEAPTLYAKAPELKDLPLDQRPLFLDYYRAIREKIKHSTTYPLGARRNFIRGSTLLSFVLANDGTLKEAVVRKSSGNKLLDKSAIQSLEGASPFPPFPIRLRQPRLRLTIQISYELE